MNKLRLIAQVLLLYVPFHVNAQYYSDRPLEMTFEHSDMFFTPSFINPMGDGPFRQASVLTSTHPLSALQRNPADAGSFSKMHDFRNGSGERKVTLNRLGAALDWQLTDHQKLSLAAMFSVRNQETETNEKVNAYAEYYSYWQYLYQNGHHYSSEFVFSSAR